MAQLAGTRSLIDGRGARLRERTTTCVDAAAQGGQPILEWLADRLPESHRSPRLGERLYAGALWHGLDDDTSARAGARRGCARPPGRGRRAHAGDGRSASTSAGGEPIMTTSALPSTRWLDRRPCSDDTVLPAHAGGAGAHHATSSGSTTWWRSLTSTCGSSRCPRSTEASQLPTAMRPDRSSPRACRPTSPSPRPRSAGRPSGSPSFYREYNGVQLHGLAIHEAMPGHVLQLAHAQRLESRRRRCAGSGAAASSSRAGRCTPRS